MSVEGLTIGVFFPESGRTIECHIIGIINGIQIGGEDSLRNWLLVLHIDIEENVIANVSAGDRASGSIGNIESRMDQGGHRHGHRAEIRFPQAIYELIIKLILPYEVGIRDVSYRSIRILNGGSIGRISDSSQGEGRPLSNGIIL